MRFLAPVVLLILAACSSAPPLTDPPADLGDFRLGYAIVVADNAKKVPPSREASSEEWKAALTEALNARFGRYEGDRLYHIALNVDGYALAYPGIPIIASPRSILVISANVWDDAEGRKLHEKPEQMNVFEDAGLANVVGTGLVRSREEQMKVLATNAAGAVERWMIANREAWFTRFETAPSDAAADAALAPAAAPAANAPPPPPAQR